MTATTTTTLERLSAASENVQEWIATHEDHEDKFVLLHAASEISSVVDRHDELVQATADTPVGWQYSWDRLNSLVTNELRIQLWNEVVGVSSTSEETQDMTVTVEAVRAVAKQKAGRLLNNWDRGASTDGMSNAIEGIKAEVNARFVQYFSGDELTVKEAK